MPSICQMWKLQLQRSSDLLSITQPGWQTLTQVCIKIRVFQQEAFIEHLHVVVVLGTKKYVTSQPVHNISLLLLGWCLSDH